MLRQEQAKRMSLAEKVDTLQESLHEALTKIAEANGQHQRLVEVVGELRDDLRHSVETHKKLREELAEEVSARGAAARTLKEESLIQKYDLVRLVNQETEARETLKDTVLQHEVKLSQQAESIMLIRKEACDTKLATNKLVEDTLNECKVTVTGAATRAASALEQEIEKTRAAESEMVARANVLESSCRTLKSDLQEAAAAHAALRDHVDQHTDPQLSQLAKQHGDLEASTLASQTELKDTLDKIHRHVREDLRLELNQMQENHVLTEKNLNSEQNAMSSLICRMQRIGTNQKKSSVTSSKFLCTELTISSRNLLGLKRAWMEWGFNVIGKGC